LIVIPCVPRAATGATHHREDRRTVIRPAESAARPVADDAASAPQRGRPFLNVSEAAEAMRLDQSTLYRHLREGRFPGVKVGGRYLVPAVVIEQLVNDAVTSGRCVGVDQWSTRWRDEQAAKALAAGQLAGPDPAAVAS
jgi:excisionase family DNA binding protein